MERWHPPLGRNFTLEAEALADWALYKPVVDATAVNFRTFDRLPNGNQAWGAMTSLNGLQLRGFVKFVTPQQAATEVFIANLATMLNLPAAPVLAIGGIHSSSSMGLFSQPAYRDFTTKKYPSGVPHASRNYDELIRGAEPVSLGAASLLKEYIGDEDAWGPNIARSTTTHEISLFDYQCCLEGHRPLPQHETLSYSALRVNDETSCMYQESAAKAAALRIFRTNETEYLKRVVAPVVEAGLPLSDLLIRSMMQRRSMYQHRRQLSY